MKILKISTFLILLPIILVGQLSNLVSIEDKEFNEQFSNKKHTPKIKIEVLNFTKEDIKNLKIDYSFAAPFEPRWIEKMVQLNAKGIVEFKLEHPFPYQEVNLTIGKLFDEKIFVNTDLIIQLDANILRAKANTVPSKKGIKFSGSDGELNIYLNKHSLHEVSKQKELYQSMRQLKRNKRINSKQFYTQFDSVYAIVNKIDEQFISQNPSKFSWIIKNERQSNYYLLICSRYKGKEIESDIFEKIKNHKSYLTSINGMKFYKMLSEYLSIRSKMNNATSNSVLEKTIKFTYLLDSLFDQPKSDLLKIKISSKEYVDQKLKLQPVLNSIQTTWCKNVVEKQYQELMENDSKIKEIFSASPVSNSTNHFGEPFAETPFGAKLYKIDSLKSKALLANLKHLNENKAFLIDFWATWCGPCLHEMPYSKTLHQESKDLPIEFIYICTSSGSNIEEWKSKVTKFELSGTHLFLEKNICDELMELFSVTAYPSYIFINQSGIYKAGAISFLSRLNKNRLIQLLNE